MSGSRTLIVTTSWPADEGDPAGHFVRAHARRLEREGHAVEVVRPSSGGAFGWPGVAARVEARPWVAFGAARWVAAATRDVAAREVDRVVAHWAVPCAWPIGVAARGAELQVVSHGGDVRLLARLPARLRVRLVEAIASRASRWTFVSEALRAELLGALPPSSRAKLEAITRVEAPLLELPDVAEAVAARRRALSGARVGVSVGRLVASKRVDRAIEHVAVSGELDALVVVGDGPERGRLERLARERAVDVRFVGKLPRDEALAWIGAATALLHASEAEGLSTVVREADALGTRVVRLEGASPRITSG